MSNPNKSKGTAFESAVRDYLNERLGLYRPDWREDKTSTPFRNVTNPHNVKRQTQEGVKDVGDLHAHPFIIECKDVAKPAVPTWLKQGAAEAKNAGFPYSAVVHKKRNHRIGVAHVHVGINTVKSLSVDLDMPLSTVCLFHGFTLIERGVDESKYYATTDLFNFARLLEDLRRSR